MIIIAIAYVDVSEDECVNELICLESWKILYSLWAIVNKIEKLLFC